MRPGVHAAIGATTITNGADALLFSLGDLAIGGSLDGSNRATGQATTLNNNGAIIEALGNAAISARTINNTNTNFTTRVAEVSRAPVTEFALSGSVNHFDPSQAFTNNGAAGGFLQLITPEGTRDDFHRYDITRIVSETQVATSNPGQILAAGNLDISADTLLNRQSRILAGGALSGIIGSVNNPEEPGSLRINNSSRSCAHRQRRKWHHAIFYHTSRERPIAQRTHQARRTIGFASR